MNSTVQAVLIVLAILAVLALVIWLARPWLRTHVGPRIATTVGRVYQERYMRKLKKQYPEIAERFAGLPAPTPDRQEQLAAAFRRLPPQQAQRLYFEFNRLKDGFVTRHPELQSLLAQAQSGDPRAQAKAMDALLKLPEDKRKAISKDFLWAWDQLNAKFPALVGSLMAAYKKESEAA